MTDKTNELKNAAEAAWLDYEYVDGHLYKTTFINGFLKGYDRAAAELREEFEVEMKRQLILLAYEAGGLSEGQAQKALGFSSRIEFRQARNASVEFGMKAYQKTTEPADNIGEEEKVDGSQ